MVAPASGPGVKKSIDNVKERITVLVITQGRPVGQPLLLGASSIWHGPASMVGSSVPVCGVAGLGGGKTATSLGRGEVTGSFRPFPVAGRDLIAPLKLPSVGSAAIEGCIDDCILGTRARFVPDMH